MPQPNSEALQWSWLASEPEMCSTCCPQNVVSTPLTIRYHKMLLVQLQTQGGCQYPSLNHYCPFPCWLLLVLIVSSYVPIIVEYPPSLTTIKHHSPSSTIKQFKQSNHPTIEPSILNHPSLTIHPEPSILRDPSLELHR